MVALTISYKYSIVTCKTTLQKHFPTYTKYQQTRVKPLTHKTSVATHLYLNKKFFQYMPPHVMIEEDCGDSYGKTQSVFNQLNR